MCMSLHTYTHTHENTNINIDVHYYIRPNFWGKEPLETHLYELMVQLDFFQPPYKAIKGALEDKNIYFQ